MYGSSSRNGSHLLRNVNTTIIPQHITLYMNTVSICSNLILFFYLHIPFDMNSTIPFTFNITSDRDGFIPWVNIACDIYSCIVISSCVWVCILTSSNTTLDDIFTTNFIWLSLTYFITWFRNKNSVLFGWYTTIFDINGISISRFNRSLNVDAVIYTNYITTNINSISISWLNRSLNVDAVIYTCYTTNINGSFLVGYIFEGDSFCWEVSVKRLRYSDIAR